MQRVLSMWCFVCKVAGILTGLLLFAPAVFHRLVQFSKGFLKLFTCDGTQGETPQEYRGLY